MKLSAIFSCLFLAAIFISSQCAAQDTVPGLPCDITTLPADTPIRLLAGSGPIPYLFACGVRGSGTCIPGKLDPGLVVSAGPAQNGLTCVSGGDSTSGWVPTSRLAPVPADPHASLSQWVGWWRQETETPAKNNDRLLITRTGSPGVLHISGRAYWYGANDDVHFGEVNADAKPIGNYLHAVQGDDLSGCVVDLKFDPATHTISAYDNMRCGGMNVRFARAWTKFTPAS